MFYGAQVWDPVLIVAQILVNQCLFYTSLGLLLWLLVGGALPFMCWQMLMSSCARNSPLAPQRSSLLQGGH